MTEGIQQNWIASFWRRIGALVVDSLLLGLVGFLLGLTFFLSFLPLIVLAWPISIIYLYIFNRIPRQSLHDLVVVTYVVNANKVISYVNERSYLSFNNVSDVYFFRKLTEVFVNNYPRF